MSDLPELCKCPFCGNDAVYEQIEDDGSIRHLRWSIGCKTENCFGYQSLTTFPRKVDAAEAWNRRV